MTPGDVARWSGYFGKYPPDFVILANIGALLAGFVGGKQARDAFVSACAPWMEPEESDKGKRRRRRRRRRKRGKD